MAKRPNPEKAPLTRRQLSRARREARIQRTIIIGVGVVGALVIGLLLFAIVNEALIKPRQTMLSVNGEAISAAEFEDRVKFDYYVQTGGQPLAQLGVDEEFFGQLTLSSLTDELVLAQKAAEMGISIDEAEVQEQRELAFGYDAGEPEPTATGIPTDAAETNPTATPTFVYTVTPSPAPTLEPGVTPTATPSGDPTATPTPLQLPTAEPLSEEDYSQRLSEFTEAAIAVTGLSEARILELLDQQIRSALLQQKLLETLEFEVDETKETVHAAHILVETQEEAAAALQRLEEGEAFDELAAELSTDSSNAYRGGDLGWLNRGDTVEAFEEVAFSLEEGEVSEPVETSFGWHIITVYEREDAAETTAAEREQQRREAFSAQIDEWVAEANIEQAENWQRFVPDLP